jgi:hypothetical protein
MKANGGLHTFGAFCLQSIIAKKLVQSMDRKYSHGAWLQNTGN